MNKLPQLKLHVGKDKIMALEEPWRSLQHHPNSDFEHFLLVCSLRSEVVAPLAFSFWKGDRCVGIVCGRIENISLGPTIGYLKLPSFKTKCLTIIHKGILGEIDEEGAYALMNSIKRVLQEYDLDLATFHHLPERFEFIWKALRHERFTMGAKNPKWTIHRALTLESKPGFLLNRMSSKHRSWVRRKEREINESFSGKVSWKWHNKFSTVDDVCEKMETVAARTYQRGLGAGFIDNFETRKRLELFASRDQLRVMLLEVKDDPVSFWYGLVYKNEFHASATNYTPEVEKYEVGTQTLLRTINALIEEGVEKVDFGLGDASYKARFSNISWREATVQLFRDEINSRLLRRYILIFEACDQTLRRTASKIKVSEFLKKKWRSTIRPK